MDKDFKIERLKKKKELFTFIFLFLRISFVKCFILETKCPNWCLCPLNIEKKKKETLSNEDMFTLITIVS